MEEREISFRDLVFDILLHWRCVSLCMLIGGIVFGVSSYIHLYKTASSKQTENNSLSQLENNLTQTERAAVEQALSYKYSREKWQAYIEDSALMELDASKVYQADLIFSASADGYSVNPVSVYLDLLNTADMYRFISKEVDGLTISGAQELIRVSNPGTASQKQESSSFHITVMAGTKKECRTISKAVQAYVNHLHRLVADSNGEHSITLLQDTMASAASTALLQEQTDMWNRMIYLNTETAKLLDGFSEPQMQYYRLREAEAGMKSDAAVKKASNAPAVLKSAVWGIFFATVICIFVLFFLYIMDDRLRYTDDCMALYQVPTLGRIPAARKGSSFFSRIDQWLYGKRSKELLIVSAGQAAELCAALMQMAAQKKGLCQIYGVCCGPVSEAAVKTEQKIQDILNADNIGFQIVGNLLYDSASIQLLNGDVHTVVLIEKAGSVQYVEIRRELEILARQEILALGFIVIE